MRPGHQPGRDDQLVVAELVAVGQRHGLRGGIHRAHPVAEPHGDVVLLVELGRLERHVVHLGAQHFLRQRRPVVGQMVLVADDRDRRRRTRTVAAVRRSGRPPARLRR